jgi:serine phosphatase RsbU (regulator of sigma subunit)
MNPPSHEQLLKEKALLLLSRERELAALRKRHERAVAWLDVSYKLAEIANALLPANDIFDRFARNLIGSLQLQAVCFHELLADGVLGKVLTVGHVRSEPSMAAPAYGMVRERVAGMSNMPKEDGLRELGKAVGLQRFLWYRLDRVSGPSMLVVAGYDATRAVFYAPFDDEDLAHFTSLAHHLEVLLGNQALISELEGEKRALQRFNQELEARVNDRTRELADRNQQLAQALGDLRDKELRITDDLEQARTFQRSILPVLPRSQECLFEAFFRPVDLVGGDIYDVSRLSDGRFRIFMTDATGHGVQASMRTVVLKAEYDRVKHELVMPGRVLEAFNRTVVALYSGSDMLCTACCVDVVPSSDGAVVHYANAAQPALVHVTGDEAKTVYSDGPFLGLTAETEVPTTSFGLAFGDRLLVYTDGLSDQTNRSGAVFDLVAHLNGASRRSLSSLVSHVVDCFDKFRTEAATADDVTLVALEISERAG